MKWMQDVEKISEKYGLTNEQKEVIGIEMTLLLLGIIHPVEFQENMSKELNLRTQTLEKIQEDIDNLILKDAHQDIIGAFNKNKQDESSQKEPEDTTTEIPQENTKPDEQNVTITSLPINIDALVKDTSYQSKLYEISKTHELNVEQMGSLDITTTKLLRGEISPEEFKLEIQKNIGLSEEITTKIVEDVKTKIFTPIREQLKKLSTKQSIDNLPDTDTDELKSHGIEILPEEQPQPVQTSPSKMLEGKEEPLEIQAPAPVPKINPVMNLHPLLNQKLSGSVQTVVTKNQYGVNNAPIKAEGTVATTPVIKTSSYKQGEDPYRIKPGE
jgi:hypothetical protein